MNRMSLYLLPDCKSYAHVLRYAKNRILSGKDAEKMDLLQLRYFCHAASSESFTKTAQAFSVPASGVSQSVRRLEKELGSDLFTRSANRITLNPQGRAFYQSVQIALEQIDSAAAAFGNVNKRRICAGYNIGRAFLVQAISEFLRLYPDVEVSTKPIGQQTIRTKGALDEFDLYTADGSLSAERFVPELVLHEPIVLLTAKGAFPGRGRISAEELSRQSFIIGDPSARMRNMAFDICASLGFTPRIAVQCEYSDPMVRYVKEGIGVALVAYNTWYQAAHEHGLELRDIGEFSRDIYIYRRRQAQVPEYQEVFYRLLREQFRRGGQLMQEHAAIPEE